MAFEDTSAFTLLYEARDILLRARPDISEARRLVGQAIGTEVNFAEEYEDDDGWPAGEFGEPYDIEFGYARSALADLTRSPPRPLYALAMLERCLHPAPDAKETRKHPLMILPQQAGARP